MVQQRLRRDFVLCADSRPQRPARRLLQQRQCALNQGLGISVLRIGPQPQTDMVLSLPTSGRNLDRPFKAAVIVADGVAIDSLPADKPVHHLTNALFERNSEVVSPYRPPPLEFGAGSAGGQIIQQIAVGWRERLQIGQNRPCDRLRRARRVQLGGPSHVLKTEPFI